MKIKPQQYAQVLIAGLEDGAASTKNGAGAPASAESGMRGNAKDIAEKFWHKLQRNNQYKDLPKILLCLDSEYAKQNNKILVQVYSSKALDEVGIEKIREKLTKKLGKELILNNVIIPNQTAGIIVKADDVEIDLSLENKVNRLKNALNNCI